MSCSFQQVYGILIILLIPTVTSLLVTAYYAVSFQQSVFLMGRVAALKPMAESVRHVVFEPNGGVSEADLRTGIGILRSLWCQ